MALLSAIRDGRLIDPAGLIGNPDGYIGCRPTLLNPPRSASVAGINACPVAEGQAPSFRVVITEPESDEGCLLYLEVKGGVSIWGYSIFVS